ncbi:Rz1-like lysis system protein LysC [Haemophilus influenzae]|uniref:Rz1-like lysis system protein LysC n=1 Tax=Haemophilus influenzae TaxID=727 RepID=UPI000D783350|nr:Rz1-like lysis system protein LysC [Haemophilus influenzae]MCK8940570.1 Rz1-like lysis system protein LysC [Haemophilus influenzae]RFN80947.1 hypothetical protein CH630_01555 [Haemophilus influenzae]BBE91750.1 hypothetical protein CHBNII6_13570 [Haemophilus influenzae]GBK81249.1 hypothetical protein NTHiID11_15300 [Haemophilus influenzae]
MYLNQIKIGLIALCLMMLNACSTQQEIIKSLILCPQTTECSAYSPQIRTNGELAEAYLQTQHHLDLCIIENSSLKKCMDEFNKKEQP